MQRLVYKEAPRLWSSLAHHASCIGDRPDIHQSQSHQNPRGERSVNGRRVLFRSYAEHEDISVEQAIELYDKYAKRTLDLMLAKNHDYDEAWRNMRITSYTDLILMKINRTKQIEDLAGNTLVSEGVDANYMDMINYSVFGLIKLSFEG